MVVILHNLIFHSRVIRYKDCLIVNDFSFLDFINCMKINIAYKMSDIVDIQI